VARKYRAPEKLLIIVVESDQESRSRRPECGQRSVKWWRSLDVHAKPTFLESALLRIVCARHGKTTAAGALGVARRPVQHAV
jgi:transposase